MERLAVGDEIEEKINGVVLRCGRVVKILDEPGVYGAQLVTVGWHQGGHVTVPAAAFCKAAARS